MRLRTPAQRSANRRRAKTIMGYLMAAAMFLGLAGYLGNTAWRVASFWGWVVTFVYGFIALALAMTALGLIFEAHHSSGIDVSGLHGITFRCHICSNEAGYFGVAAPGHEKSLSSSRPTIVTWDLDGVEQVQTNERSAARALAVLGAPDPARALYDIHPP